MHVAGFYEYGGFYFSFDERLGPLKLRRSDDNEAKRTGVKFWKAFEEWFALPVEDRLKYEV